MKMRIVFVLCCLILLSSCGSKSDDQLTVGVLVPLTGEAAVLGKEVQQAVQLAADNYNAISDEEISVVFEDSRCFGKDAVSAFHKLVSINRVQAIVGPLCSSETLAIAPLAELNKVVVVSPASTNPSISLAGEYIFRVIPSDALQGKAGADLVWKSGLKSGAVLYVQNDYGVGLKDVFKFRLKELGGVLLAEEGYVQGSSDFRTQIAKIKEKNPEFVYLVSLPGEGGLILKQLREMQLGVSVFGAEGIRDPSVIKVAGEAAEGLVITYPQQIQSERRTTFVNLYKERYGSEPGTFAAEGYDAFNIIAVAYRGADDVSKIKDVLYKIKNFQGASGPITFDANGDVDKPYAAQIVRNGEFVDLQ